MLVKALPRRCYRKIRKLGFKAIPLHPSKDFRSAFGADDTLTINLFSAEPEDESTIDEGEVIEAIALFSLQHNNETGTNYEWDVRITLSGWKGSTQLAPDVVVTTRVEDDNGEDGLYHLVLVEQDFPTIMQGTGDATIEWTVDVKRITPNPTGWQAHTLITRTVTIE